MRTTTVILLVAIAAAAGAAPLRAQPAEEIILADPAFSLTFSAGYVASDLGLWQKHGVNVKTVSITGIGAINSVISGSSQFAQASASSFGRASARGQKLVAIATTIDRPFAQVVLRKDIAEAGGFDPKAPLGKRGALLKGRTIAVDSINSMIHVLDDPGRRLAPDPCRKALAEAVDLQHRRHLRSRDRQAGSCRAAATAAGSARRDRPAR